MVILRVLYWPLYDKSLKTMLSLEFDLVISICSRILKHTVKNSFPSPFSSFCAHLLYWQDFLIWCWYNFSLLKFSLDWGRYAWPLPISLPMHSAAHPPFCLHPILLSCLSSNALLALLSHFRRSGLWWGTKNAVKVAGKEKMWEAKVLFFS